MSFKLVIFLFDRFSTKFILLNAFIVVRGVNNGFVEFTVLAVKHPFLSVSL